MLLSEIHTCSHEKEKVHLLSILRFYISGLNINLTEMNWITLISVGKSCCCRMKWEISWKNNLKWEKLLSCWKSSSQGVDEICRHIHELHGVLSLLSGNRAETQMSPLSRKHGQKPSANSSVFRVQRRSFTVTYPGLLHSPFSFLICLQSLVLSVKAG